MANTNCLEGMRCPACGNKGPFQIQATSIFLVYDDGTDSYENVEWDGDSFCACVGCRHEGTVGTFRAPVRGR